jgi:TolC family type I secretion outer membrane protein
MSYLSNWNPLKKHLKSTLLCTAFYLACSNNAQAISLNDAFISAHEFNYQILAETESLEATKISKMQSYAGFMPRVSGQFQNTKTKLESNAAKSLQTTENVNSRSLTVTQPIFSGGDTYADIKIAENNLSAGHANFMNVSNDISLRTVSAYEGILNSRDILKLNQNNEKLLRENLKLTKTRFKHGEVTKTDVLQAESRLSNAIANRERAEGEVKAAEATYVRIVGTELPDYMDPISLDAISVPGSFEEFLEISLKNNPALLSAKHGSEATKYQVNKSYAAVLPQVSAQAQFNRTSLPKTSSNTSDNNSYVLNVSVPLLANGGREYGEIARTQHLAKRSEFQYKETERQVRENSVRAWNAYKVAKAVIKSSDETISASKRALEGVQAEAKAGTRTTLDVLNAQNELFSAQVNKRSATKDLVESVYSILQLMGALDAVDIIN